MEINLKRALPSSGGKPKKRSHHGSKQQQSGFVVFENQYLTITNQGGSSSAEALALARLGARAAAAVVGENSDSEEPATVCYEVSADTDAPASSKEACLKPEEGGEPISVLSPELYDYYANNKESPPGPPDVSQSVYHGPCQPTNVVFPLRSFGKDSRAFKQEWYLRYTWLEYSFEVDAAFCFACRFFAMPGQNAKGSAFTTVGFRNWKRAMEGKSGLRQHDRSEFHQRAFERWMAFNQYNPQLQMVIAQSTAPPIPNTEVSVWKRASATPIMWNKQTEPKKRVEDNCRFLKAMLEAIRFGTATDRVYANDDFFGDQINYFKGLVSLIAKVDETVSKLHRTGVNESVLLELIDSMTNVVKLDLFGSIKHKTFAIVFVECEDRNDVPVLAYAIRFFHQDSVTESFLGYQTRQSGLTEDEVIRYLSDVIGEGDLELKDCIGQTYDHAPGLTNYLPRLPDMISQLAPQALNYHSSYRNVDGLLIEAARKVHSFNFFLPLLKKIVTFFECCPLAKNLLEQFQLRHYPDDEPKSLSRFTDQPEAGNQYLTYACVSLKSCYGAAIEALSEIAKNPSLENRCVDARSVLSLMNLDFIFCLVLTCKVYEELYFLSDYLADEEKGLSNVFELLNVANSTLIGLKTEDAFQSLMEDAEELAAIKNKAFENAQLQGDVIPAIGERHPKRENVEDAASVRSRESVYNMYIDCVLSELNLKYNEETQSLIHAVDSFNPRSVNFLNFSMLESVAEWYNANESDLQNELKQLQRFLERQKEKGESPVAIEDMVKHLVPFQEAFYESFKLLRTVVTLSPEANCASASAAKVKDFFKRNSLEDDATNSAFLVLENQRLQNIRVETLLNNFKEKHANRIYKFF